MLFSSTVFLFLFLPVLLAVYYLVRGKYRNYVLLAASLLFYAWGEPQYVFLMLLSIAVNYCLAVLIGRNAARAKIFLILSVLFNLGLLGFFKYIGFFIETAGFFFPALGSSELARSLGAIPLPIGISFFTFQVMSYVIDVYRGEVAVQKNVFYVGLYVSLFPQLIAGPIVRYVTVAQEIEGRRVNLDLFYTGVRRFIVGLGKKVLLANNVAFVADQVFRLPASDLYAGISWLGLVCYTLQIYFDFSGYSDMAIGLGKMFGFNFLENFNYPYVSRSIKEFWRRWHISLSTWFRDYLYIPLGGSRKGTAATYRNLLIVFILCGFWHGASWSFVLWGAYHGLFLVLERIPPLARLLEKLPRPLQHAYAMLVVMVGWVLFRADTLAGAMQYLRSLVRFSSTASMYGPWEFFSNEAVLMMVLGAVLALPFIPQKLFAFFDGRAGESRLVKSAGSAAEVVVLGTVLFLCITWVAAGTYSPFIYFRF